MTEISLNQKRLLDVKELSAYTGMSPNFSAAWGKQIGAAVRIGRRVFYDRYRIDEEINNIAGKYKKPTESPLKMEVTNELERKVANK